MIYIVNNKQSEQGRSMTEMLGVLAIVGVLSAGAIGGYSYAMNKHRTNELIYEATKRAQWVGTQLEMNNPNPSLNTFGTDSFGGGSFGAVTILDNNQFGITVTGLKEAVCHNILNSIGDNTVIREMRDVNCSGNNGTAILVFNRDLGTTDSEVSADDPEVSGEVSAQASTEAPTTQDPDEVHCNGNGSWNGSSCYCDNGWQGDNCSEEEPESGEPATINNEPEETATEDHRNDCGEHGTWYNELNNGAGGCYCYDNWYGPKCACYSSGGDSGCSAELRTYCSNHGTWRDGTCYCDSGYGGVNCSVENPCASGVWIPDTSKPNGGFCEGDQVITDFISTI